MTLDRSMEWFEEFLSNKTIISATIHNNTIKLTFSDETFLSITSLGESDGYHGFLPSKLVAHTVDHEAKEYRWLSWEQNETVVLTCSEEVTEK